MKEQNTKRVVSSSGHGQESGFVELPLETLKLLMNDCSVKLKRCDNEIISSVKNTEGVTKVNKRRNVNGRKRKNKNKNVKEELISATKSEGHVDLFINADYKLDSLVTCESGEGSLKVVKPESISEFLKEEPTVKFELPSSSRTLESLKRWGTRYKLLNKSQANHSGKPKRHQCPLCQKSFAAKHQLELHLNRHTGEKPYKCPVCSKGFLLKAEVTVHLRVHSQERPFTCKTCGKSFIQKSHILHHERLHSGERPYKCYNCGKSFVQQENLDTHVMRNHSNYLPYLCHFCNKGFTHACHLKYHVTIHTGELPFPCKTCGQAFRLSVSLRKHAERCGRTIC